MSTLVPKDHKRMVPTLVVKGEQSQPPHFRATNAVLKEGVRRSQEMADEFHKTGKLPSYS